MVLIAWSIDLFFRKIKAFPLSKNLYKPGSKCKHAGFSVIGTRKELAKIQIMLSHQETTLVLKAKYFPFLLSLIPKPAGPLHFSRYFRDTSGRR